MWNILIAIIIIAIIFMLNPLKFADLKPSVGVDKKTQSEVNQVVNDTQKQVDYARKMQQQASDQEQNSTDN